MFIRNAIINLLKLPLSHRFSTGRNTNMVKVLNVAEKNDAAKCIADVMSRGRFNRKEGFSKFNKLYEFEYMLFNQRCNMRTLEREVRGSQFLVVWTDCDREGENIGFEELEKLASRKLRINAKETMRIAEKLYTNGFISYPRTETNMFTKEIDLRALGDEKRVYEFVVRHFLACCSQDAQGFETTVEIDVAEEREIPVFDKGDEFEPTSIEAEKIDESLSNFLGEEAQPAPADSELNRSSSSPVLKCPMCGSDMLLKAKKDGKGYTGCVGGCDETLVTDVGIRPPPRPGSGAQSQRTNSTPSQRGGGQAGPRSQRPNVQPAQGARGQTGIGSSFGSNGSSRQFSTQSSMQSTFPRNTPNQARNQSWGDQNMFDDSFDSNFSSQTQTGSSNFSQIPTGRNSVKKSKSNTQNSRTGSDRVPLATMTGNVMDSGNNDSANSVVCNCGNDAVLLTVRKEGPNTGRQFYKCGGSTCNFFLWSDEAGADPGGGGNDGGGGSASFSTNRVSSSSYSSNRGGTSNYGNNSFQGNQGGRGNSWSTDGGGAGGGDTVTCQCGQPAKSLTVQKEGPNKGRPFYGCPQPRGQGCTFFQWGDEDPGAGGVGGRGFSSGRGGGGASRGRGGSKKRPASSDGGGPAKKGKKCGLCGVEGHTKRTCPHK
ncbi:TOP3A-like protein [Mya arenaria]|uniref:DNA topoisomerase n=1 Tax=Mya arenaria TaxID=6604 RepID=A0ABY7DH48_MYAAR|nr:TOP3A-like protein [Mya arenaria]